MSQHPHSKSLLLIGAGNWGKNLARNFHILGALHTICDTNPTTLKQYSSLYPDVNLTTDLYTALNNPDIDKVVIAAPAALHYTLAKQVLESGKDVLVEKPLSLNVQEAEELIHLANEKKRILMVGHLLQYHPCIQRLQEMVEKGELGKLQYIVSNRLNLGSIRTEENALWSFAPHDISVILSLCRHSSLDQITCFGEAYLSHGIADTTMTSMRFQGNLRAHVYVSWLHPFKEQKLVVIGSSGMAFFDDTKPWEEKLSIYRNYVTWNHGTNPQPNKVPPEYVLVQPLEPLKEECCHFLICCQQRSTPKTDGNEGLRVLKVLQAAQSSLSQNGTPVSLALSTQKHRNFFAHPTAVIDSSANINEGTKIWHFSHIMDNAIIGKNCNIGQNVVISPKVIIGNNVKIQNNVSVYTGVICQDDVFLGPSMVFTNVINPRSAVNRKDEFQTTLVKRGATIGANATIICGIILEEYCFIGAGAVVTKNVKPYALIVGNPATQIGWMSRHGEKLDLPLKLPQDQERIACCPATGERYLLKGDVLSLYDGIAPTLHQDSSISYATH